MTTKMPAQTVLLKRTARCLPADGKRINRLCNKSLYIRYIVNNL